MFFFLDDAAVYTSSPFNGPSSLSRRKVNNIHYIRAMSYCRQLDRKVTLYYRNVKSEVIGRCVYIILYNEAYYYICLVYVLSTPSRHWNRYYLTKLFNFFLLRWWSVPFFSIIWVHVHKYFLIEWEIYTKHCSSDSYTSSNHLHHYCDQLSYQYPSIDDLVLTSIFIWI